MVLLPEAVPINHCVPVAHIEMKERNLSQDHSENQAAPYKPTASDEDEAIRQCFDEFQRLLIEAGLSEFVDEFSDSKCGEIMLDEVSES